MKWKLRSVVRCLAHIVEVSEALECVPNTRRMSTGWYSKVYSRLQMSHIFALPAAIGRGCVFAGPYNIQGTATLPVNF